MKRSRRVIFIKNKKLLNIDDINVNKILSSNKNHTAQKVHLNISLDIMMIVSLDHFV